MTYHHHIDDSVQRTGRGSRRFRRVFAGVAALLVVGGACSNMNETEPSLTGSEQVSVVPVAVGEDPSTPREVAEDRESVVVPDAVLSLGDDAVERVDDSIVDVGGSTLDLPEPTIGPEAEIQTQRTEPSTPPIPERAASPAPTPAPPSQAPAPQPSATTPPTPTTTAPAPPPPPPAPTTQPPPPPPAPATTQPPPPPPPPPAPATTQPPPPPPPPTTTQPPPPPPPPTTQPLPRPTGGTVWLVGDMKCNGERSRYDWRVTYSDGSVRTGTRYYTHTTADRWKIDPVLPGAALIHIYIQPGACVHSVVLGVSW